MTRNALVFLVLLASSPALAQSDGDRFVSEEWHVTIEFPPGWNWTDQQSYPGILVSAVHRRDRARMTLAVTRVPISSVSELLAARAQVDRSWKTLLSIGFQGGRISSHPTGALILDATAPDRATSVRQATFLHEDAAYVLTLAAPLTTVRTFGRAFDDTLRRMVDSVRARPNRPAPRPAP